MLRSTAGDRKRRPRSKAAITFISLLAVATGVQILAPTGAAAMTGTGTGPCVPVPGTNGEYRTHQGAPCEVLPSVGGGANLVVPSATFTFTGSAPIQPQGCRGYGCGLAHDRGRGLRSDADGRGGRGEVRRPAKPQKAPKVKPGNDEQCTNLRAEIGVLLGDIEGLVQSYDAGGWTPSRTREVAALRSEREALIKSYHASCDPSGKEKPVEEQPAPTLRSCPDYVGNLFRYEKKIMRNPEILKKKTDEHKYIESQYAFHLFWADEYNCIKTFGDHRAAWQPGRSPVKWKPIF